MLAVRACLLQVALQRRLRRFRKPIGIFHEHDAQAGLVETDPVKRVEFPPQLLDATVTSGVEFDDVSCDVNVRPSGSDRQFGGHGLAASG